MTHDKNDISEIELLLRQVCFQIKKNGRVILEEFSITPPQFDALQYLVNCGEHTISELSTKLYLAPSTITDLVDRMEKNDLVERVRSTEDRRTVKVRVLPKGHKLIEEVINLRREYIDKTLIELSSEDKEQFIKYLSIFNESSNN